MDKKWKRFEDLAASIQRSLAPTAKVEQDIRIVGKTSGVERQIDIAVRTKVGQFDLLVVVDCKDYRGNVDVKDVEGFVTMLKDVEANKGALVAAKGFSEAARKVGSSAGISLYTLIDAESEDWPSFVTIPVLVDDRHLEAVRYTVRSTDLRPLAPQGIELQSVFGRDGTRLGRVRDLAPRAWDDGRLPIHEGIHENLLLADGPLFMDSGGRRGLVEIAADIQVRRTLYFGHLPLAKVQGFYDAHAGELHTRGMTTDWLDIRSVRDEWKVVPSENDLAVVPVMTLVETTCCALDGEA